ncbi:MAG: PIG-L deacetylase family protein [bacterium]
MNILAIGAHPDDIEYSCSGTLIKYSQTGHQVFMFILSNGEAGGDAEIRKREQEDSCAIIGVKELLWGGFKDTMIPLSRELIVSIENIVKKVKPDLVLVNYNHDTHQDHRNLADAVISATRQTKNLLFYESPTSNNFVPTVFVDISTVLLKKLETLQAHRSQVIKTNIESTNILELATSTANFRGIQSRVKYAEGFMPNRLFICV